MKRKESFAEIYDRYSVVVTKAVMARTHDMELAEEICQNVFLAYFKNMDKVEPTFVKAWLLDVTENQIIDHWRKESVRKKVVQEHDLSDMMEAKDKHDVEKIVSDRRFIVDVMKELKKKNNQWYEVVDCVCIQQMSQDEASEYLHVPKQDLKSRLYRARQFLRDIFQNER